MKHLIIFSFLFLTACDPHILLGPAAIGPKFKVGDCVVYKTEVIEDAENWEKPKTAEFIELILEVGKRKYKTKVLSTRLMDTFESQLNMGLDGYKEKIECPKELKGN